MVTTIYAVTGMTCEHCARAVTQEVEELGGVRGVTVDLVPGGESRATMTGDRHRQAVTGQAVAAALDEARSAAYRMVAVLTAGAAYRE